MLQPTDLKLADDETLLVTWADGQVRRYAIADLRKQCPCANCREKRMAEEKEPPTLLPVLPMSEAQPLKLLGMQPMGNYAYVLAFNDGHDTGIYTFEFLRALGEVVE